MEKILQVYCKELDSATNNLVKLSVTTSISTFLNEHLNQVMKTETTEIYNLVERLYRIISNESEANKANESVSNESYSDNSENSFLSLSDSSFLNPDESSEKCVKNLLHLTAMKCIYDFTKSKKVAEKFDPSFLKLLVSCFGKFCDSQMYKCNFDHFRFCRNFTNCVKKYLDSANRRLEVKVISEKIDELNFDLPRFKKYFEFYEPETAQHMNSVIEDEKMQLLSLSIDLDAADDIDLVNLLIDQQVALKSYGVRKVNEMMENSSSPTLNKARTCEKNSNSKSNMCQIVFRKILNGNLFWVNRGKESIEKVEMVQSSLNQESVDLKACSDCKINDEVVALITPDLDFPTEQFIRAKVLSIHLKFVQVFALDFGGVYKVHRSSIFMSPQELSTRVIPQQVQLACFHDIAPVPCYYRFVELSLTALTQLIRSSTVIVRFFLEMNMLRSLPALILCKNNQVCHQALRLATNVTRYSYVGFSPGWQYVLLSTLEFLNQLARKYYEGSSHSNSSSPRSNSPTNTGDLDPSNNDTNTDLSESVTKKLNSRDKSMILSAARVVGNCIHLNSSMKELLYQQNGLETILLCQNLMDSISAQTEVMKVVYNYLYCVQPSEKPKLGRSSSHGQPFDRDSVGDEVDDEEQGDDADVYEYDESSEGEPDEENENDSNDSINNAGIQDGKRIENKPKYLIKGSKYSQFDNPRYELINGLDLSSESLIAILCGFFNSGEEGTVSIGVSKDGKVLGEKITYDMRDELRLGMSDLSKQLSPFILHFQLDTNFIPVLESEEDAKAGMDFSHTELFVIELLCKPVPGVIHTCTKTGKCFYRTGGKTCPVNEQEIRHLIVLDVEKKSMDEILLLKRRIVELKNVPSFQ